jgi:GNAT superfamily N-acetyltransferase
VEIKKLNWNYHNEIAKTIKMFVCLTQELFPQLASNDIQKYVDEIAEWKTGDLYITYNDTDITGFAYAHIVDSFCKPHYFVEHIFVEKKHRNSKAAYLLYNEVIKRGDELGLCTIGNAHMAIDSIAKRFGKPLFTQFIREVNNGRQ